MTSAADVTGVLNRWARQDLDMLGGTDGHALECLLNDYFSVRKNLIAGYYHILHDYTMKQVLKGTRKRMIKGLVVTFTLLIVMMVSLSLIIIINSLITAVVLEYLIHQLDSSSEDESDPPIFSSLDEDLLPLSPVTLQSHQYLIEAMLRGSSVNSKTSIFLEVFIMEFLLDT